MLTIKCAKCKSKLFKYKKIGKGKVLKCYKNRITRVYDGKIKEKKLICSNCNNVVGEEISDYIKMERDAFTYSGRKIRK